MMGLTAKGCLGRVLYDQSYDLIITSWKYLSGYDSDTAKKYYTREVINTQRKSTTSLNKKTSFVGKYVSFYNTKGNQQNE